MTKEEFIEKANKMHENNYLYNNVNYINNKTKVKIICKLHGIFEQRPDKHTQGQGCPECGKYKNTRLKSTEQFIKEAKNIYGNKYDYRLTEYKGNKIKIKIICKIHGIFEQLPINHLKKQECCPYCNGKKKNIEEFIKKANLIHNNKYDYTLVVYINANTPIKIICPVHGEFKQLYRKHLQGQGCPKCRKSLGEESIRSFLKENNFIFKEQKKFDNLKDNKFLFFDFYIPNKNLLIEFNGVQHYYNSFNKPLHEWHRQLHHDWMKRKYAKENGITLLVIPYWNLSKLNLILAKSLMSK